MPLIVYASLDLLAADAVIRSREHEYIDLSSIPSNRLVEQAEAVRMHQTTRTTLYFGFLDPLTMLTPHHETRLRKVLDACRVIVLTSDPGSLSLFWKNGITELYLHCSGQGNDDNSRRTEIVDNGCPVLPSDASRHRRSRSNHANQ